MKIQSRGLRSTGVAAVVLATVFGLTGSSVAVAGTSSNQAKAKAIVAQYSVFPTTVGNLPKLGKTPPRGKTIAIVDDGLPSVTVNVPFIKQAAAVLGWTVKDVQVGLTAASQQAGWAQIVRLKPNYVYNLANGTASFASACKQLASEHVAVFDNSVDAADASGYGGCVVGLINDQVQFKDAGAIVAADIAAANQNAHVLFVTDPAFTIIKSFTTSLTQTLHTLCTKCTLNTLNISTANLGTPTELSQVVGYVRATPSINYIAGSFFGILGGVPAALKTAGKNIPIVSETPATADIIAIAQGGMEKAAVNYDEIIMNWKVVDLMARYSIGERNFNLEENLPNPFYLYTKADVSSWPAAAGKFPWPQVASYKTQFETAWGVK